MISLYKTRQIAKEARNHSLVVIINLAIFCGAGLALATTLMHLLPNLGTSTGITRLQPGQAIYIDPAELAHSGNQKIVAVETLNTEVSKMILAQPLLQNLIATKSATEVAELLPPETKPVFDEAMKIGAQWYPESKPWGLFALPENIIPLKGTPFGLLNLPDGAEKTRIDTERAINRTWAKQDPQVPNLIKTLQQAVNAQDLKPEDALALLAAAELLAIEFSPEKNLFLSKKTLQEWVAEKSAPTPP